MQQFTKLDKETKVVGVTDVDPYGAQKTDCSGPISEDLYCDEEGRVHLILEEKLFRSL